MNAVATTVQSEGKNSHHAKNGDCDMAGGYRCSKSDAIASVLDHEAMRARSRKIAIDHMKFSSNGFHFSSRWFLALIAMSSGVGCQREQEAKLDRTMSVRTQTVAIISHPHTESLTGEYRARVQSDLSFRIGGRISSRMVDVGDHVNIGDLLATIDSLQQTADVTAAMAALRSAEASLQQAAANARRIESLLPSQSATQSEFDDAKAVELTAQGSINISKSVLATAENQRSFTELRAVASGVIIARDAEAGQVVNAAQKVFTLAVDGEREAVFDAFQNHVSERPIDDKVELALVSNPNVRASGFIREISPSIDRNNGTVRVKVAIPDPPEQMTLGAPVMGIARFQPMEAVKLPWTALSRQGDSPAVWVLDPNTQCVKERAVEVESYESGELLITGGLQAGETVVVEGTQLLRPNQRVKTLNQKLMSENTGASTGSSTVQKIDDSVSHASEGASQP